MSKEKTLPPELAKEMRDLQKFADKIEVKPYSEVKEYLDGVTIATAKESAAGFVKLFEELGVRA